MLESPSALTSFGSRLQHVWKLNIKLQLVRPDQKRMCKNDNSTIFKIKHLVQTQIVKTDKRERIELRSRRTPVWASLKFSWWGVKSCGLTDQNITEPCPVGPGFTSWAVSDLLSIPAFEGRSSSLYGWIFSEGAGKQHDWWFHSHLF